MTNICFYLHVHQPPRLKNFSIFNIGKNQNYFDKTTNNFYLNRIARKSYNPSSNLFLRLIKETKGEFKLALSLSGVLIEQLEITMPEVIESFNKIVRTGSCELIAETYYHSLASYFSQEEFEEQVRLQVKKLKKVFKFNPTVFRNTELLYFNNLAETIHELGFKAVLIEGADKILQGRLPNNLYSSKGVPGLKLLLKNYKLSDDIAFRFSDSGWKEFPLTSSKFIEWIKASSQGGQGLVNIFMDYETFGEHQWKETGIFNFFEDFVKKVCDSEDIRFLLPGEVVSKMPAVDILDIDKPLTWADSERDLSAWIGNDLQKETIYDLYSLEREIKKTKNRRIINDWRNLQTSDHFYYMCTKWFNDGDVHKYFNHYDSPYDAYINYMNVLRDLKYKIKIY